MSTLTIHRDDEVTWLGLNRPDKRNALDLDVVAQFHSALDDLSAAGPNILIVHSVTPGIFAAGTDITELARRRTEEVMQAPHAGLFQRLARHRWPTIAVVDGPAFGGGCELALACDIRIGSSRARFAQPEPAFGILAGAGANWRLPQLVGIGAARRMLYLGDTVDAAEASRLGLIDRIAAPAELDEVTKSTIAQIRARSWRALEFTKLALRRHCVDTTEFDLVAQALLSEGTEKDHLMTAFLGRKSSGHNDSEDRGAPLGRVVDAQQLPARSTERRDNAR